MVYLMSAPGCVKHITNRSNIPTVDPVDPAAVFPDPVKGGSPSPTSLFSHPTQPLTRIHQLDSQNIACTIHFLVSTATLAETTVTFPETSRFPCMHSDSSIHFPCGILSDSFENALKTVSFLAQNAPPRASHCIENKTQSLALSYHSHTTWLTVFRSC